MAALTAPQFFIECSPQIGREKVKGSAFIRQGGVLGFTTAGFLHPFATGDFFAGHALEDADNSSGADGDIRCNFRHGNYIVEVPVFSSATVANIGDPVWTSTDNHADLTLTDPGTTKTTTDLVGYVAGISDTGNVKVRFISRQC